jgi:hypothetical protein
MGGQAKDKSKPKADAAKKENGTVLLTPEELQKISGGAGVRPPNPVYPTPNTNNVIKQ